jgi:tetratricopeptide (TPR) repeat protein
MKQGMSVVLAILLLAGLLGCGGPEERKAKYLAWAKEYIQDGNLPKARVALRNVLKIDPKDPEAYFFFAEVEEKEQNWRNAFANYQQVVELRPDHERALLKLAKFYLEARAIDKVLEMTDKVLDKSPGQVEAEALRIAVQAVKGNLSEATLAAEALDAKHPTDPDAATILATLYLAHGRPGEVEPVMQRALDANPGNLVLLDSFASALIRLDKSERAEEVLKKIVVAEPKVLDHRLRLAGFYDGRREYDKAETILREVIRLDPDNEQRHLGMAKFEVSRHGVSQGETALLEAKRALPRSTAIQFALGELYDMSRQPDKARAVYEQIRDDHRAKPAALEATVKLAALDWSAGKQDAAEKQLAGVLKENPLSFEAIFLQGKIALQRGNGKDAIQAFRTVLKDRPELAEAHALLGRAYLMTGEMMLAREGLDRALSLKPTLMEAQMMLAGLDASVGHIKEARERLDPLVARDPGNVALLGLMFQLQTQEKDWGQSQETLTKLRTAGADQAVADLAEGHMALAQQLWEKAEAAYARAAEQHPMAPEPLLALVQLGVKRGQVAQTQSRLEAVLIAHPDHPYADGFLGELLLMRSDVSAAIPHLESATRLNPKWSTPWVHLARYHYTGKRTAEGDEALLKGLQASPEDEQMRLLLAVSLSAQRRFDEAIGHYETVLQKNPKSVLAANNLAATLVDYKSDTQSLERALALSRAFESQTPNPYLLDTLGWAHYKLDHSSDAVRLLKQATALAPDHPVLNYHLGAAFSKSGQPDEARVHLKKAMAAGTPFEGMEAAKALLAEVAG